MLSMDHDGRRPKSPCPCLWGFQALGPASLEAMLWLPALRRKTITRTSQTGSASLLEFQLEGSCTCWLYAV